MADSKFQPTIVLPTDSVPSDAEENFIDETPPNLFPENQDSNWGFKRKVFSDIVQDAIDQLDTIFVERFVDTSTDFLDEWEEQMLIPTTPSATLTSRRNLIHSRMIKGAFTRSRRNEIIEHFLFAGGAATQLTPDGVTLDATGTTLYGESGNISTLYRVYDNPSNFSYDVWIVNSFTPDIAGLTRELTRLTPAGITFTIDNAHSAIIDWGKTITAFGPSGWWKLAADYLDSSGLGHSGTVTGAPTAITSPGLVIAAGADAARDFSGTGQYATVADSARLNTSAFSIHALVRPDALPSAGQYEVAYSSGSDIRSPFIGIANFGGSIGNRFVFRVGDPATATTYEITGTSTPVIGVTYSLLGVFNGKTAYLYVNGVLQGSMVLPAAPQISGTKTIGGHQSGTTWLWNGGLDEIVYLGYPLSAANAMYLYKQATNTL
jgi:Concanavalin A-like lectin/glucanases superfamily